MRSMMSDQREADAANHKPMPPGYATPQRPTFVRALGVLVRCLRNSLLLCVFTPQACSKPRVEPAKHSMPTDAGAADSAVGQVEQRPRQVVTEGSTPPPGARAEACQNRNGKEHGLCCRLRKSLSYAPASVRDCDETRCTSLGGRCGWASFDCPRACVARARDANRPCNDESQCESTCVAADQAAATGTIANGRCYPWALASECLNRIQQGKATGVICVD